jgi:hypothetical protein
MRTNPSQTRLWMGAGVLLCGAFAGKQLLWTVVADQVKTERDREHAIASLHLKQAQERAKFYVVPPRSGSPKDDSVKKSPPEMTKE